MATHCTGIGPILTTIHMHHVGENEDETMEVKAQLVAFTWTDDDPTKPTGYWYNSPDLVAAGLVWVPAEAVSIDPPEDS